MSSKLEHIHPRRVSLVKRGANLRRILLAKTDEDNLDGFVANMLAAPVEKEDELLAAVEASKGDESVAKTVSTLIRAADALREPYGDAFRDAIVKAAAKHMEPDADDEEEDEVDDPAHARFNTVDARAAIEEENGKGKGKKKPAASVAKALGVGELSKEDAAGLVDAIHQVLPQWHMERVMKADPKMTPLDALNSFYKENPHWYEREQARQAVQLAKADEENRQRSITAAREFEQLVKEYQGGNPSLTKEQAAVAALRDRPDLYQPYTPILKQPVSHAERDARIERAATERRKREPNLSHAQAVAAVLKSDPDLYRD